MNIFWFIIDSVRTFRSGQDDRDRIDIIDEFAKDSVEFTNCFTSAPSSLLASGALFSGLPSVYIARHFNDWKYTNRNISTIRSLVEQHNYSSYSLLDTRNQREKLQNLIPPLKRKYLPKGYNLYDYSWKNNDLTKIFAYIMKSHKPNSPFCFNFWYDCRRDPQTSFHVSKAIDIIKENGYYDNSIIIMNSDHGYPDPRTKINEAFFSNLSHDMILTDDNIKTPLLIKYPNCPENTKINHIVGHIDILPTIYDILGVPYEKIISRYQGESLLPIINGTEGNDRIRRTDTRLAMDTGKITSLTSKNFKYIYFYDDKSELLFDRNNDPDERNDIAKANTSSTRKALNDSKELLKDYSESLFSYHKETLNKSLIKGFSKYAKKYNHTNPKIIIIANTDIDLLRILTSGLSQLFNHPKLYLLTSSDNDYSKISVEDIINVKKINSENLKNIKLDSYKIAIYLTENSRRVILKDAIVTAVKKIKSKHYILLNYNFEPYLYFSFRSIFSYFKIYFDWDIKRHFYKEEPIFFLKDLGFLIKKLFLAVFLRDKKIKHIDVLAAKEIMEYRNSHLKKAKGVKEMSESELEYETERIKNWRE